MTAATLAASAARAALAGGSAGGGGRRSEEAPSSAASASSASAASSLSPASTCTRTLPDESARPAGIEANGDREAGHRPAKEMGEPRHLAMANSPSRRDAPPPGRPAPLSRRRGRARRAAAPRPAQPRVAARTGTPADGRPPGAAPPALPEEGRGGPPSPRRRAPGERRTAFQELAGAAGRPTASSRHLAADVCRQHEVATHPGGRGCPYGGGGVGCHVGGLGHHLSRKDRRGELSMSDSSGASNLLW